MTYVGWASKGQIDISSKEECCHVHHEYQVEQDSHWFRPLLSLKELVSTLVERSLTPLILSRSSRDSLRVWSCSRIRFFIVQGFSKLFVLVLTMIVVFWEAAKKVFYDVDRVPQKVIEIFISSLLRLHVVRVGLPLQASPLGSLGNEMYPTISSI